MIYLVAAMSCVVIITVALWVYARYARLDMNRLAALEEWSDDYFDCATKLAEIDKAPAQLLDDILALNRSLDDQHAAWELLRYMQSTQTHESRTILTQQRFLNFYVVKNFWIFIGKWLSLIYIPSATRIVSAALRFANCWLRVRS